MLCNNNHKININKILSWLKIISINKKRKFKINHKIIWNTNKIGLSASDHIIILIILFKLIININNNNNNNHNNKNNRTIKIFNYWIIISKIWHQDLKKIFKFKIHHNLNNNKIKIIFQIIIISSKLNNLWIILLRINKTNKIFYQMDKIKNNWFSQK